MKNKLKSLIRWALVFAFCFLIIFLVVFFGGWKLFESGNPILIELGASFILSVFIFILLEVVDNLEKRVKVLEDKLNEFDDKK